jgi:hypothetical protein
MAAVTLGNTNRLQLNSELRNMLSMAAPNEQKKRLGGPRQQII